MATAQDVANFDALMASGNYGAAAALASNLGVDPNVVANYVNTAYGDRFGGTTVTPELVTQAANQYVGPVNTSPAPPPPALTYVAPAPTPAPVPVPAPTNIATEATVVRPADPVAQQYVDDFNALINQGNYEDAARLVKDAELAGYGENAYRAAAVALEANTSLPSEIDFISPEGIANIKSFVDQYSAPAPSATPIPTPATPTSGLGAIPTEAGTPAPVTPPPQTTPNAGQIYGLPALTRQAPTPLTFAPLRRGSTQLRPAMYMPGLTSRAPALGGSGIAAADLRNTLQSMTAAGQTPADVAYMMDVGGVSPAELSAATGMPTGQIQGEYNLNRPGGTFSTTGPTPTGLPQDFRLQTGAYEAATSPTFLTLPEPKTETKAPTPAPVEDIQYEGRKGGVIKMAEGGEAMAKLTPAEAGSQFDVSEFIDEQGRLVGGYSKPIRDQYGVITGYDYQPYQRDVVFNPRLAEAEALGMSDEEREAARRGLIVRQGMTGVDPYAGGLAGIVAREAMMRNRPQYYSYAKGGDVSATAQDLASRGRSGDTMLVHMAPHEVAGLNAIARMQGTELTINPETGMPEALKLGKLFKQLAPFIPFIPGVGQFMAPFLPSGLAAWGAANPLLAKAVASGVIGGFTGPKGGFDLQRGLMQGITAYGMSNLMQNLGPATATPGGVPGGPSPVAPEFGGVNPMAGAENLPVFDPMAGIEATTVPTPVDSGGFQGMADTARVQGITNPMMGAEVPPPTAESFNIGPDGEFMIAGEGEVPTPKQSFEMRPVSQRPLPYGVKGVPGLDPSVAAPPPTSTGLSTPQALLTTGLGATSLIDYDKSLAAQLAIEDEEKKNKRLYRDLFNRTLGQVRTAKQGGLMKLAGGGMTYMEAGGTTGPTGEPRDVTGTGDGMSDSVPANIEGVQEARLADGEFVIPADVVADIGNGSSDAGSKKLYDMMDRIRMARHGTKEQPPEIKAERLMPA